MNQKIISIIPARGGSKGIPKKNLIDLCGKPLLHYSLNACISSKYVTEAWVSSDCDEILSYAQSQGARALKRPDELCIDTASSELALLHFAKNVEFDIMIFVQATSPMISTEIIDNAFSYYLNNSNLDSLVSGYADSGFWWNDKTPLFDPLNRPTRQAQGNLYKESGMFYILSRDLLLSSKCRYSGTAEIYPVDRILSLEVDSMEDLKLIEFIMNRRKENV
jgi:N-acylneuraminate cytidylyltransferase